MKALGPDRNKMPTVWELVQGECRAGIRRYAGSELSERYSSVLAHHGTGDYSEPGAWERTLGDYLHPLRPGRAMSVVNGVSREMGMDVQSWRWERVLGMYAGLERGARDRESAGDADL